MYGEVWHESAEISEDTVDSDSTSKPAKGITIFQHDFQAASIGVSKWRFTRNLLSLVLKSMALPLKFSLHMLS
jgi:hypothetical protein